MADVKPIRMQKRRAMGEHVTGMKRGGATKPPAKKMGGKMSKGKGC